MDHLVGEELVQARILLESPVGAGAKTLQMTNNRMERAFTSEDVFSILERVCEEVPDLREALRPLLVETDADDFASVRRLVNLYNEHVAAALKSMDVEEIGGSVSDKKISRNLLKFILEKSYQKAVKPRKLNRYKAFSAAVYGEASFELIEQVIGAVDFKAGDIFVDMGSGVGKVVLQVAASVCCSFCWGIEKSRRRARYAANLAREFNHWMAWFGKQCLSPFMLTENDFTRPEMIEKLKANATVIFANNLNFGEGVNYFLAHHFRALGLGARIVSGESFVPRRFKVSRRTMGDLGAMVSVRPLPPLRDAVSWTSSPVSFFLHTKLLLPQSDVDDKEEKKPSRKPRKKKRLDESTLEDSKNPAVEGNQSLLQMGQEDAGQWNWSIKMEFGPAQVGAEEAGDEQLVLLAAADTPSQRDAERGREPPEVTEGQEVSLPALPPHCPHQATNYTGGRVVLLQSDEPFSFHSVAHGLFQNGWVEGEM